MDALAAAVMLCPVLPGGVCTHGRQAGGEGCSGYYLAASNPGLRPPSEL